MYFKQLVKNSSQWKKNDNINKNIKENFEHFLNAWSNFYSIPWGGWGEIKTWKSFVWCVTRGVLELDFQLR